MQWGSMNYGELPATGLYVVLSIVVVLAAILTTQIADVRKRKGTDWKHGLEARTGSTDWKHGLEEGRSSAQAIRNWADVDCQGRRGADSGRSSGRGLESLRAPTRWRCVGRLVEYRTHRSASFGRVRAVRIPRPLVPVNGKKPQEPLLRSTPVILEKGESSYGASVPALPGCIAVAEGREQTLRGARRRRSP